MELRAICPDLYEIEGSDLSIAFRGYCARIKDKIKHFVLSTNEHDVSSVTDEINCTYRQYEHKRLTHSLEYLKSAMEKCFLAKMHDHEKALCSQVQSLVEVVISLMQDIRSSDCSGSQSYGKNTLSYRKFLDLLSSFSLPEVKPRVLELTDAGPGVGCSNHEVQYRVVEKILIHKLDKIVHVHRACRDSGQHEAERTNSAIGDALVTGVTLNWEYHTQFENMSKEEIEALTLQDYEKERVEKNAWRVASELAERVDRKPAPHGFISCQVTPKDYEQFYSDQEYMSAYISASSESAKKKLPGHGYYSMIDNFYKNHCQKGELYIEFLKGSCQKLDEECCKVCFEWSGPAINYVPRPYPDYSKAGYHYMPVKNTPIVDQHGKPRYIDDFQPRAQLRKFYCNGEIYSSDEVKIHECSEKYIVDEVLMHSFMIC